MKDRHLPGEASGRWMGAVGDPSWSEGSAELSAIATPVSA